MILNNFDDDDSPTNVSDDSSANLSSSHKRQRRRRIVIEYFTKFSNSKLWDLVMRFYDQNGVSSCADGIVPHFISFQAMLTSDERVLKCFVVFFKI